MREEAVSPGDISEWHRKFASELFNHAWDLLEKEHRTEDEDLDMLAAALGSLHHWRRVGDAENLSISDWQVSRVLAVLGHPRASERFARRALRVARDNHLGPFYVGYAHEALARAAALGGDVAARDDHLAEARALLARVERAGEADLLRRDLDDVAHRER